MSSHHNELVLVRAKHGDLFAVGRIAERLPDGGIFLVFEVSGVVTRRTRIPLECIGEIRPATPEEIAHHEERERAEWGPTAEALKKGHLGGRVTGPNGTGRTPS